MVNSHHFRRIAMATSPKRGLEIPNCAPLSKLWPQINLVLSLISSPVTRLPPNYRRVNRLGGMRRRRRRIPPNMSTSTTLSMEPSCLRLSVKPPSRGQTDDVLGENVRLTRVYKKNVAGLVLQCSWKLLYCTVS